MPKAVLLDAGTLGILGHAQPSSRGMVCAAWLTDLRRKGVTFFVPALADYEVRRGLLISGLTNSVSALDYVANSLIYLPPSREAIRHASALWADARRCGRLPGCDADLNPDVVLAGQALELQASGYDAWVATDNLKHVRDLDVNSALWETVTP